MSDYLVFLASDLPPRLRQVDAEQLACELDRVTIIDGAPLPGQVGGGAGPRRP